MAENKFSPNDIPDLNQDWGQDINDELLRPYSGRAVQKLIKEKLLELRESKFGHVTYEGGALTFYDEDNGTVIASLALSGNIYTINLASSHDPNFTVITSDLTKVITITPTSKEGTLGSEMVDFTEDYTWIMSVDNGTGFVNVSNGTCIANQSFSNDIRSYLKVGFNRIRFSVTGTSSNQVKSIVLTANLTSLTLNVLHSWQRAWIEGEAYSVSGIFFSGNMQKTLNVRIDDDDNKLYTQVFSASTSYISSPFSFNLTDYFPDTTGIHKLDIWISGAGVETAHFIFDVMCVKSIDRLQAKLVCLNEVKSTVFNYEDQELFQFATYGTDEVSFNITANDVDDIYPIISEQTLLVKSEEKVPYALRLEIPTEELNGISLSVIALAGTDSQEKVLSVNNSNALAPVSGADFYMNASLRVNGSSDRELIINNAKDPAVYSYPATWSGFTWENDGWGIDDDSVKCLSIQAGSSIIVDTFKPLSILGSSRNLTIEWKLKVDNVADYNTPIMTLMSDETYNELTTNGIIVYPTSVLVLSSTNRNAVQQSVLFEEGHQLHFVVVFQRNYGATGRNLCRISINGIQQCVFEYDGSSSFGNGYLKLGQESTDLYLYMLRYYNDKAFEADSVLKNWLNSLTETIDYSRQGIRSDNDIFDGISLNYELVKQKGFNTMVVEMPNDIAIPSLTNAISSQSTLAVEYNDHPEWNFKITNAPVDGQGTTSKRYYRWNLRWKLAKGANASIWTYADGSTTTTKGWFDGNGNHLKVGRITAKKNIASSSQGHKMGATAMYDDLYKQLGLSDNLPTGARVAVYQYPVLGFQKYTDGSYQFIGLYTIGPDKGDKDTFGYDTSAYPDLLSIEGPNHAPLGTRFLHPWTDVEFSLEDETLKFGGEEGWDVATYNDSKYANAAQVLSLYEAEWKPAYDLVYFCSTYLRSLAETGLTLQQINANTAAFRNASNLLTTRRNEVVTLYDENYNLVYYRNLTSQYEVLDGHDVRTYLGSYLQNQVNPTTQELITARKAKFLAEVEDYFDIEALLYHECFLMLIGASDNHAKNMYPFKLKSLATGGRWQFRQDDLDTILATDNNGNPTKKYYVEPGDLTTNGTDIYQGSSSVLWTLLRETSQDRLRAMMIDMINGLASIASSKGLAKGTLYETIFAMFNHYFWQNSAKYFPVLAYAEDTTFGYVYVWSLNPGATYNGVYPLTQALGTQLEAEMHWSLRRILYVFSKYSIGGFNGSADDGLNSIEFTPGQAFTFNLTPAINMYPSGNLGGGTNIVGTRTAAGDTCQIVSTSDGTTTYYLKGLDWLTSLGDLSRLVLTSRGGVSTINFSVKSKRLRSFKVGDSEESNVLFNATTLAIQGQGLEEIDVQNVKTITSPVDLSNCPRLKVAKFQGSSVPAVLLPTGSKVNYLSLPLTAQNLYLNGLPILADAGLVIEPETFPAIRGFYVSNCPNIDLFNLLRSTLDAPGHALRFISLYVDSLEGTADDLTMLSALTTPYNADTDTGYGRVVYDSVNKIYSYSDQKPYLQGTINVPAPAYERDVLALRNYFNVLNINVSEFYLWTEDLEVRRVLIQHFGDGKGVTESIISTITNEQLGTIFRSNTVITEFNELDRFINVSSLGDIRDANYQGPFEACTNLLSVVLPQNLIGIHSNAFANCVNLISVGQLPSTLSTFGYRIFNNCSSLIINAEDISALLDLTSIKDQAFYNTKLQGILDLRGKSIAFAGSSQFAKTRLTEAYLPNNVISVNSGMFFDCQLLDTIDLGNIVTIDDDISGTAGFAGNCTALTTIIWSNNLEFIGAGAFVNCIALTGTLILPLSVRTISSGAFRLCAGLTDLSLNNGLLTIGSGAFRDCSGLQGNLIIPNSVNSLGAGAFAFCSFNGTLTIGTGLTIINSGTFNDCKFEGQLVIPSNVSHIYGLLSASNGAFRANRFTSLVLNEGLLTLGVGAFSNNLLTGPIVIPSTVTTIQADVFTGNTGITEYQVKSVTPPSLSNTNAFTATVPIRVYDAFLAAYKTATNWSSLISRLLPIESYINFQDAVVETIFLNNWDTSGSGYIIPTKVQAVTNLNLKFKGNTTITKFNELEQFTGVTIMNAEFENCTNLEEVKLPSNIVEIKGNAFLNCSKITGNLVIPNSVNSIGDSSFYNCAGFTGDLVIPNSVTSIGNNAFAYCTGFNGNLVIPNSVTSIKYKAFDNCRGFTGNLVIPDSITLIDSNTFSNCSGFTGDLVIPNSVITIGNSAFSRWTGIKGTLTIPNSVTSIGDGAFFYDEFTGDLVIPNSVTYIGDSAFHTCRGFTGNLVIPNSVTYIGIAAFYRCSGFNGTLTISDSVTYIGTNAFFECAGFTSVTCLAVTPPTLVNSNAIPELVPIYVPAGSVAAYKAATQWSSLSSRIFAIT